jgi:hypothetical protein
MSDIQSHENPSNAVNGNVNNQMRWKNRRRMAWTSLIAMIVVTMMLLFGPIPDSRLKILAEPLTWFFFAMASVIGAYMGFTTWASKK